MGRPCPTPDGGTTADPLFASFPDPLLAYASEHGPDDGADDGRSEPSGDSLVVRAVNPRFEAVFDVGADETVGVPLDDVVLTGAVVSDPDGSDAESDLGVDTADVGVDDTADPDATDTAPATSATVGTILARTRRDATTTLRVGSGTDEGARHFHVRIVSVDSPDVDGYLLFTDVTDPERRRLDLGATVARLERLVGVASHDIRNPLEVAKIRLEAAQDTGEDVHFETVAGALDRIERIVRDVLTVGGGGVDPTDAVALDGVATAAWSTVETADATLVTSDGLPTVRGDADRLQQLFENLFRNSVEHGSTSSRTESGDSVEHGSTTPRSQAREDGTERGDGVTVTVEPLSDGFAVTDDGPGVPLESREHVFEAGYTTAAGNSGLGLSIVARIAREHGWRVALASESDQDTDADEGARFVFTGVERVGGERGENGSDATR